MKKYYRYRPGNRDKLIAINLLLAIVLMFATSMCSVVGAVAFEEEEKTSNVEEIVEGNVTTKITQPIVVTSIPKTTTTTIKTTTVVTTTTVATTTPITTTLLKSNNEIAIDVITGKYGNGKERKEKLKEAGYKPDVIQDIVNDILYNDKNNLSNSEIVTDEVNDENTTSSNTKTTSSVIETTVVKTTKSSNKRDFVVFKESTHYIHRSTCDWYLNDKDSCIEITNTEGIECIACEECQPGLEIINPYDQSPSYGMSYVKGFSRGTYYTAGYGAVGGSGRSLIDCSWGNETVKGSIASSYLYYNYGYNYNGNRSMVYLEVSGYPEMNGYYYLDDCDAGNSEVIDFYYAEGGNCQFQSQGVVYVDCYIVNY